MAGSYLLLADGISDTKTMLLRLNFIVNWISESELLFSIKALKQSSFFVGHKWYIDYTQLLNEEIVL